MENRLLQDQDSINFCAIDKLFRDGRAPFATDYTHSYHDDDHHRGLTQTQIFRDPNKELKQALISCQEIAQNQVKILYEYEALLNERCVPKSMSSGLNNRLTTNHFLIYQALESLSKKPFFKELQINLNDAMEKLSRRIKHKKTYEVFKAFRKDVNNRK